MKLIDVLRKECLHPGATIPNKEEALRLVARTARACPALAQVDEEAILRALTERESLGSTGFGKGIAIPHCRLEAVQEFVVGVITVPDGVDFASLDGQAARVIVFIVAPARESNDHIRLLSAISQVLQIPGAIDEFLRCRTADALNDSFLRYVRDEVDAKERPQKTLFHVFIQEKRLFEDILQVLAAIEGTSIVVLDAENSGAYLAKLPLFAAFWSDAPEQFCRLIVALVDKKLANETIRRIEDLTGGLDERKDVLLTLQDLTYTAGALGA